MKKPLTLIKLGGSLITNKSKPFTLEKTVLEDVVSQIKMAWDDKPGQLLIGHGQGSFAHVPAVKYKTIDGYQNEESDYGAAVVADAACQMNRLVVAELLKQKIPALTLSPISMFVADSKRFKSGYFDVLVKTLENNMLPVIYGDPIIDTTLKYTIWSTETVFNNIALNWHSKKFAVEKVIHVGEVDGFLVDGEVIPEINSNNYGEVKKKIGMTEGFDVTGGMLHKIEESIKLAREASIESYIIGGNHGGNLYRAIVGEKFVGTRVKI